MKNTLRYNGEENLQLDVPRVNKITIFWYNTHTAMKIIGTQEKQNLISPDTTSNCIRIPFLHVI